MNKVNLSKELSLINDMWTHRTIGEINDIVVKVVKLEGEFVWHKHDNEDEMFFVIEGQLDICLRSQTVTLKKDEFFIIPKGTEHKPVASQEAHIMLIEPKETLRTGD